MQNGLWDTELADPGDDESSATDPRGREKVRDFVETLYLREDCITVVRIQDEGT